MKQHPILSYFSYLSIFAICVCFLTLFSALAINKAFFSENLPYYIVMFYAMTALSYSALYFLPKKTKMNFVHIFLITKVAKFVIYLGVLAVVFLFNIETQALFAITYFVLFLFFLVFDTITTNKLSRRLAEEEKQSKNQSNENQTKDE